MKKQRGFTLIELMVILAIVAIVAGFGVPQLSRMLQTNRADAALISLSSHLAYARSEAVKGSSSISIAGLTAGQWELGWVVFVDNNGDGVLDPEDQSLRVVNALNIPNFTITPTGANSITYERLGDVVAQNSFNLVEPGKSNKTLTVTTTGQTSVADNLKLP